jgi:ATP-dependent Zn protease
LRVAVAETPVAPPTLAREPDTELTTEWSRLTRIATFIAILTSPSVFYWYYEREGLGFWWALVATLLTVAAFRGLVDVVVRKMIPWPSLFGMDDVKVRENDVVNRRRAWTWRWFYRLLWRIFVLLLFVYVFRLLWASLFNTGANVTFFGWISNLFSNIGSNAQLMQTLLILPILFLTNFIIFMGPLLLMGISQIRGFEPGDAEWGVKLEDIRGQAEAKEEVRRVVTLWQSGETFEAAGGKRERGLLFLGAPGTGKTMLAKGIATSFNCPFVTIPGSGFAQTFIGIDAIIVRFLSRKAKKLATKWGGQCIVFIDEIDAVGMRRQSLGSFENVPPEPGKEYFGRFGALNPSGDLICETREWRDWMFEQRAPESQSRYPGWYARAARIVNQGAFPGMMQSGGLALNQLLVTMDGIDNPPFMRRVLTNKTNSFLDAIYIVPRHIGKRSMRIPRARATGAQIYFIGATNVPLERLDPALTRPGRMGRHVTFRTPTKTDRVDIFDLYLGKVEHDQELDTPARRDELARVTNGYSPAMIDQICSMALTKAHHEGRLALNFRDLMDSMTVVESGTEVGFEYTPNEAKAIAVHEAGHAVAAHIYRTEVESSRLSIKRRGQSGGHHQSFEKEDRFSHFQSEVFADIIHGVGAMAAEIVFYGENSQGVGGDLGYATQDVSRMVSVHGMAPKPVDLMGARFADESEEETQARVRRRFEDIGLRLMNRWGSDNGQGDPRKRAYAAQLLGEAFATAYNAMLTNRDAVDRIADTLVQKQEIFGDELVSLLDGQQLVRPVIDWTDESSWPPNIVWSRRGNNARAEREGGPDGGLGESHELHE